MSRLAHTAEALSLLGDESRLRLLALLAEHELNVSELVTVTGIAQSRVSTHLRRLREAGIVHDRREGRESLYRLTGGALPKGAEALIEALRGSEDPTLAGDRERLRAIDKERLLGRGAYAPGRTWRSLASGLAGLLELGDVLDVGLGDGAVAELIAPYARSIEGVDLDERALALAKARLAPHRHVRVQPGDAEALPFEGERFDAALLFHTLTYTERPSRAVAECARVLRPGGRLVTLCLDRHEERELTARYGERHPGFGVKELAGMLRAARLSLEHAYVASREPKPPYFQTVLAVAQKPSRAHRAPRT